MLLFKYYSGDQFKECKMSRCIPCIGKKCKAYWALVGNSEERDYLGELGICRRIILGWILKEIIWEGMNWIHVAHDRAKC
jgi:hypothetical protein